MSQNETMTGSRKFSRDINLLGVLSSIIILISMFAIPFGTALYFGIDFNLTQAFASALPLIAIFLPTAVAENISFYPVLGAGGMYLGSITGNVLNLKLPVAIAGQKIAGVEPGTEKGDIVAIIAVAVSALVSNLIVTIGTFAAAAALQPILEHPALQPGFAALTPSILGAVAVPELIKNPKKAALPVIIALVLYLGFGQDWWSSNSSYALLGNMLVSALVAYFIFRRQEDQA